MNANSVAHFEGVQFMMTRIQLVSNMSPAEKLIIVNIYGQLSEQKKIKHAFPLTVVIQCAPF